MSKLLELQCNWKVQNHKQGPQKDTIYYIQLSRQEKLLVFFNIAQCMRSGLTGTAVLPEEKCLSFKTEVYLLLSMFSENCLWSDL